VSAGRASLGLGPPAIDIREEPGPEPVLAALRCPALLEDPGPDQLLKRAPDDGPTVLSWVRIVAPMEPVSRSGEDPDEDGPSASAWKLLQGTPEVLTTGGDLVRLSELPGVVAGPQKVFLPAVRRSESVEVLVVRAKESGV
jgi:hypothetical protein